MVIGGKFLEKKILKKGIETFSEVGLQVACYRPYRISQYKPPILENHRPQTLTEPPKQYTI